MFLKLLKHEFAATWKVMVAVLSALVIIGFFGFLAVFGIERAVSGDRAYNLAGLTFSLFTLLAILIFSLATVYVISRIYLIIRYYRNLYTPEGYLTFTLPATAAEIISAKVLTGIIWSALVTLMILGDVWMMISAFAVSSATLPSEIASFPGEFAELFTFDEVNVLPLMIFSFFIQTAEGILLFYFSITLGQLWAKHKILGAVLSFFGISIAVRIFSSALQFIGGFSGGFFNILYLSSQDFARTYQTSLIGNLIFTLILGVFFYLGCIFITKRRVNLD